MERDWTIAQLAQQHRTQCYAAAAGMMTSGVVWERLETPPMIAPEQQGLLFPPTPECRRCHGTGREPASFQTDYHERSSLWRNPR